MLNSCKQKLEIKEEQIFIKAVTIESHQRRRLYNIYNKKAGEQTDNVEFKIYKTL